MIELRHLRYFLAVAEDLNFRRAAERVHIDQTSLSRAIRDLEDQLDAPLFVRLPRRLHLGVIVSFVQIDALWVKKSLRDRHLRLRSIGHGAKFASY